MWSFKQCPSDGHDDIAARKAVQTEVLLWGLVTLAPWDGDACSGAELLQVTVEDENLIQSHPDIKLRHGGEQGFPAERVHDVGKSG